jgi:hypothetical protein
VADFATDLEHWLARRPVTARVPGPLRAVTMWVGRHRAVSALAASLIAALAGGAVIATLSARDERTARESADLQRARVEGFLRQSREFVPWLLTDHQRAVAGLPRSAPVVRSLANEVRAHLAALSYDQSNDPALILTAARSYLMLAEIEGGFGVDANGLRAEARADAETSIRLARRSGTIAATPQALEAEASAEIFLARFGQFDGDLDAAERHAESAARAIEAADNAAEGSASSARSSISTSIGILRGDLRLARGDVDGALTRLRSASSAIGKGRPVSNATLFELLEKTAITLLTLGREDEAATEVERLERLGADWERAETQAYGSPTEVRRERYRAFVGLGNGAQNSGKTSPLPYLARALALLAAWRESSPTDRAVDREEAQLRKRVGAIQLDERLYAEAVVSLGHATTLARRLVEEDPADVVSWQVRLEANLVRAEVEQRLGHADESERLMVEAETTARHIQASFPKEKEAWLAPCRVVLTRAALDSVAGEAESDKAKACVLLASAVAKTREGGALYREAVKHGFDSGAGLGIAAACDAEAARLQAVLEALGPK